MLDEFVYDPFRTRGELSLSVIKGAFLYVGGLVEGVSGARVRIQTPAAAIGVRGTTVWGGPIDNGYGVVVLSGEVTVTARRGRYLETRPGNDALWRRQTSAGRRLACRPHEARRRLN